MRPEEYVVGMERSEHQRGLLEQHEEEFEEGSAEAYDEQVAENRIADRSHHDDVLAAVRSIFEERPMSFDELELSEQERSALEALRSAQNGKHARYNTFVYAEQRRELLEQALAALQPILALDVSASMELKEGYEQLVEQVGELRERLVNLEDAQDEVVHQEVAKKGETEDGDEDDKGDGDDDGDRPSTLSDGPALPERVAGSSTLSSGPAVPELAAKPSTLSDGPALPERAPARSVLGDEAAGSDAPGGNAPARGGVLSRIGRALGLGGKPDDGGKGSS